MSAQRSYAAADLDDAGQRGTCLRCLAREHDGSAGQAFDAEAWADGLEVLDRPAPPLPGITQSQLALVELAGALEPMRFMVTRGADACEADGVDLAPALRALDAYLAKLQQLVRDRAFPINPVVRT